MPKDRLQVLHFTGNKNDVLGFMACKGIILLRNQLFPSLSDILVCGAALVFVELTEAEEILFPL